MGVTHRFHRNAAGDVVRCSGCVNCNGRTRVVVQEAPAMTTTGTAKRAAVKKGAVKPAEKTAWEDLPIRLRESIRREIPMPDVVTRHVLPTDDDATERAQKSNGWGRRWSKLRMTTNATGRVHGNPASLLVPHALGETANLMTQAWVPDGGN